MLRGTRSRAEASAWTRSPIGKAKPIRYVVVTYLQSNAKVVQLDARVVKVVKVTQ
jgi:hypothetical protein